MTVVETDQVVPFEEHQFTFGAFFLKYEDFEDTTTEIKYSHKRDTDKLLTLSLTSKQIDPVTGDDILIALDLHKCTEDDVAYDQLMSSSIR